MTATVLPFRRRYSWDEYHKMLALNEELEAKGVSAIARSCVLETAQMIKAAILRQERKDRIKARRRVERGPFAR